MSAPSAGAVIYAKDVPRLSRFYSEVAALAVVSEEGGSRILQSPGFQLVLVETPAHIANRIAITSPPVRRENTAVKLVFPVRSLAEARARAAGLGGALNGVEREWLFQGQRVCDGHDPEGNVVQFREERARAGP